MSERIRNARGQGDRLRSEIVAAAERLVDAAPDPSAVTLRAIAREAGISAPSIYAHFDDLQGVLDVVLARGFDELDRQVAAAMSAAASRDARLVDGCLAYVRFAWRHPARYRFMFAGTGFAPDAIRTLQRISDALAECIEGGLSSCVDPRADAFLLWASMHGLATLEKPVRPELRRLGSLDRAAIAETLARRVAGLAPAA